MSTTTTPAPARAWYEDRRKLALAALGVLAMAIIASYWSSFSGIIGADESTKVTAGQVQNQLQRMADLIPNLVDTAKAGAAHENQTLTRVTEARASATRPVQLAGGGTCSVLQDKDKDGNPVPGAPPRCDPGKLSDDPAAARAFAAATQAMGGININAIREAYPTLQGVKLFADIMVELAGSTNRISVARRDNLRAVQDFNMRVRRPPGNIVASIHGFAPKPYFEAASDAQTVPRVKF